MEEKKIVMFLVAVIIILACILGAMFLQPTNAKDPSIIKITSDKTLYEGDSLSIQLTDLNKTPISNENVYIEITNENGEVIVNETLNTNSEGNAKLELDLSKGDYIVNVTFAGNENFTGNITTQKLTIEEEIAEPESSSASSGNSYVDSILNDPTCTVVKDPYSICPKHGVPYWQDNYCDWFIQS